MELVQSMVLIIVVVGSIIIYAKYFYDKKLDELEVILTKKCPRCGKDISNDIDIKDNGCSGSTINVDCSCGYSGSFSHPSGSCSI